MSVLAAAVNRAVSIAFAVQGLTDREAKTENSRSA